MKIPSVYSFTDYIFAIKDNSLTSLNFRDKKIALIALAAFCALAVGWYVISFFFQAKQRESLSDLEQEDGKAQHQFEEQIKPDKASLDHRKSDHLKVTGSEIPISDSKAEIKSDSIKGDEVYSQDEQDEIDSQEIDLEEIQEVQDSLDSLSTCYQAHIGLVSRQGMLAGSELQDPEQNFDFYDWQFPDGNDLPVTEDTLLLKFMLFHQTNESKELFGAFSHFYLPEFLFAGKKEGDTLTLKYKGELVRLLIDQNTLHSGEENLNFEDGFECSVEESLKDIKTGKYGFGGSLYGFYRPMEGYTLDFDGILYHSKQKDSEDPYQGCDIVQANSKDFRKLKEAKFIDQPYIAESDKILYFRIEMCGIGDQVDIVVNEKFLCFFAQQEERITPKNSLNFEYLCIIRWMRYFENLSLEEMQDRIKNAKTKLADGIFTIEISK